MLLGDAKEAKQRMDEALAADDLPLLFHVSTLVARGATAAASATNSGEYEDHRFLYAKKLLAAADAVKPSHPLAAHIAERYAWSLMDQWKVEEASKQFQAAYHIRLTNKEEKNPFAAIYVFHDRHGMAMASRYRGNLDAARRTYKTRRRRNQDGPGGGPAPARRAWGNRATSAPSANGWPIPWNAGPIANSTAAPPPMEKSTCPRPPNPTTRPARSRPTGAMRS